MGSVSVEKFLRQRAVNVVVGGHYTLSNWLDPQGRPRSFSCRTSRVSPFRMMVEVPVVGRVGDRISTYFGNFGQLDGEISATVSRSFLLELMLTRPQRQRMADQLTWLEKMQRDPTMKDARRQSRIIPASPHSMLTFADGSMMSCFVIDMSATGAAVCADVQPEIGTPLAVGACVGRVVRQLKDGFAVKFIEEQHREGLERRVIRPMPVSRTQRAAAPEPDVEQIEIEDA